MNSLSAHRRAQWTLMVIMAVCAVSGSVFAEESEPRLLTVDWRARAAEGLVEHGDVVELDGRRPHASTHGLKVVSPAAPGSQAGDASLALTAIENPGITRQSFALSGWIKHTGIEGEAYLEMWAVFPDGSRYFTRTLGGFGSTKSLSGDSDWREIALPFQMSRDPQAPKPNKLIVNAVFAGAGEIVLSDLALIEADNVTAAMNPGAWWSDTAAGWVGGIGGTLLGLLGAATGILAGLGRARRLVIAVMIGAIVLGSVLLPAGLIALASGQPYGVYYPLLLSGVMGIVLGSVGLVIQRQRYATVEMRRMQALDA